MLDVLAIRQKLGLSQKEFANKCGVHWRTVQNWEKNPDAIPPTTTQFLCNLVVEHDGVFKPQQYYGGDVETPNDATLPLIPYDVLAGNLSFDNAGVSLSDCERYAVPEFASRGAEFLIRVSGDSMFPRYNNGDILACKRLNNVTFIQWGKVYVIDTTQGILVKHLFPSTDEDKITCHSVNTANYPDFDIPKEDIRSFSLVLGVIALE